MVEDRIKEKFTKEYTSKFDIDLKFGEEAEYSLAKILSMGKVEVKTERDIWKRTGNIVIELKSRGKYSGLSVTEAEWWAHILSYKGKKESIILIPVVELKKRVKALVKSGKATLTVGGDDDTSEIALVPIKEIHGSF
jgi:hypothetical protein